MHERVRAVLCRAVLTCCQLLLHSLKVEALPQFGEKVAYQLTKGRQERIGGRVDGDELDVRNVCGCLFSCRLCGQLVGWKATGGDGGRCDGCGVVDG